jgi:hypothetical protein
LTPTPAAAHGAGMSDPLQRTGRPSGPRPTAKQQAYLRRLERGVSFTPPATKAEDSRLIDELKRRRRENPTDVRRERKQDRRRPAGFGWGVAHPRQRARGYGSSATWKRSWPGQTNPAVELARYRWGGRRPMSPARLR